MNIPLFFDHHTCSREITDIFLHSKNLNVGFYLDTMKAGSFKLFMIITLLRVYIVVLDL